MDARFEGPPGHRMAEARGQSFHPVKASAARQPRFRAQSAPLWRIFSKRYHRERTDKETDELGIKDQSTGTSFMVMGQVNPHRLHVLLISGDGAFFLVEVWTWPF